MWYALAYQSTGVIYGDIGTSPLYVYSSTFTSEPSHEDLVGALSLIIYSVTIMVTIKYVLIILSADNEGEGGSFAMYNLLTRYSHITNHDPRRKSQFTFERYGDAEMKSTNRAVRSFIEREWIMKILLKVLAVLGVSMILADSILTPAQSVLGAIQGLRVVNEDISTSTIIGASCAILILLFLLQPLGIHRLASTFAPIVIIWLTFNMSFGIYNLTHYDHSVLKAFSPYFAGNYLMRNKTDGWMFLGGILLSFTGVEAMFADMGAFSQRAIQISWLGFAYPCLLLAYIGQAAYISVHPAAYSNPFFNSVPPGMFYPALIASILAAVVASQALITSTFQLLSQLMNTSYFPHISVRYTSDRFHGQVYIPTANWIMMCGTVLVTAVFNNTTSLGHAYRFCVIVVTFIDTWMVSLVALIVWQLHSLLVFIVWLPIVTHDGLYLSTAVTKIPRGAWFTLMLAIIMASFFIVWRYGKERQWTAEGKTCQISRTCSRKTWIRSLSSRMSGAELRLGMGIFFDKTGDRVPAVYEEFLRKFEAQPEVCVFMHLRALHVPYVSPDEEDQYTVTRTQFKNTYRVIIRYGYKDQVIHPHLGSHVYSALRRAIIPTAPAPPLSEGASIVVQQFTLSSPTAETPAAADHDYHAGIFNGIDIPTARRLTMLDDSFEKQVIYIVGKEQLHVLPKRNNICKRLLLGLFVWVRENTREKIARMQIPIGKLVEVGFVREI
ncbi:potassium transporter [Eremomyces bilateralis CBS 781.70]|uniref:Potassium transporter n=1 Tax=Eremomyces bilateralis CBS 781.70 TaxID=1392243 RepID=A0A6G1FXC0_9PEZI|nr:potassium transporter [Eremomyces bilateralis CBS 781.70]KAF1810362.1 potassium transporter [Eremomyces bilateralis CBS 781.70]